MAAEVVARWFGSFLVSEGRLVRAVRAPTEPAALGERLRRRRAGERTPEEDELLAGIDPETVTRDRRLVPPARLVRLAGARPADASQAPVDRAHWRAVVLAEAERALEESWDPSVHLAEAIRAMTELEQTSNLVAERLTSWAGRDTIGLGDEEGTTAGRVARELAGGAAGPSELPGAEPELIEARRSLAAFFLDAQETRKAIEAALEVSVPRRMPNLSRLLGAVLTARMVAQAGGLDRLARLPASTIQVLGAEKAFFEHLRGRAPPPRHGWLFVHPEIQGAPKRLRGKLARALAAKVAIAARLDQAGRPELASVSEAFRARAAAIRALPRRPTVGRRGGTGSAPPLDRAAQHR